MGKQTQNAEYNNDDDKEGERQQEGCHEHPIHITILLPRHVSWPHSLFMAL
jgi:hypothetical protein